MATGSEQWIVTPVVETSPAAAGVVSVRQVVAYNMVRARRERGMTQDELGASLTKLTGRPWSRATVSAAETGWDGAGKRVRHFDVNELAALALALRVPVSWFFTPPPDGPTGRNGDVRDPWITPTTQGNDSSGRQRDKTLSLISSEQLARLALDRGKHGDPDDLLARRLRAEGWGEIAHPQLRAFAREILALVEDRYVDDDDDQRQQVPK
jgi:transcriptional regulator with XRE-family HTH domain